MDCGRNLRGPVDWARELGKRYEVEKMFDAVMLALGCGAFALFLGYAALCASL
jgi:hypothetical protein